MKTIMLISGLLFNCAIGAQEKLVYVKVTVNQGDSSGAMTLECEPLQTMENMPKSWVELCNKKGLSILKKLSERGQSVNVTEKPFGVAGDLAEQNSRDLPVDATPVSITSPDLSIR